MGKKKIGYKRSFVESVSNGTIDEDYIEQLANRTDFDEKARVELKVIIEWASERGGGRRNDSDISRMRDYLVLINRHAKDNESLLNEIFLIVKADDSHISSSEWQKRFGAYKEQIRACIKTINKQCLADYNSSKSFAFTATIMRRMIRNGHILFLQQCCDDDPRRPEVSDGITFLCEEYLPQMLSKSNAHLPPKHSRLGIEDEISSECQDCLAKLIVSYSVEKGDFETMNPKFS